MENDSKLYLIVPIRHQKLHPEFLRVSVRMVLECSTKDSWRSPAFLSVRYQPLGSLAVNYLKLLNVLGGFAWMDVGDSKQRLYGCQ